MFKDTNQYTEKNILPEKRRWLILLLINLLQGRVGINCPLLDWNNPLVLVEMIFNCEIWPR